MSNFSSAPPSAPPRRSSLSPFDINNVTAQHPDDDALIHHLNKLTIAPTAATSGSAPASPRTLSPRRSSSSLQPASPTPSNSRRPSLPRSPNATPFDASATTNSLLRKASTNSLRAAASAGSLTPPRRGSAQLSPKSPVLEPERPAMTAETVARGFFTRELATHESAKNAGDVVAIIHDACYGHRFSRPRTSRAALSTIVERPERVHASVLGIAAAYVRLGERHADGHYAPDPRADPASFPHVPFGIRKSTRRVALSSPTVTNVHGTKWMEELQMMCETAEKKLAMNGKELVRPDMPRDPKEDPPSKFHEGDLYLCAESLEAMEGALGAVCDGVDAVFRGAATGQGPHRAFVTIRPPGHHCSSSYPSGFCWINNVHVGISHAALTHGLTHAVMIDFDLHHGDGSQAIAWDHNTRAFNATKKDAAWKKTHIAYYSIHDINSYPCEMGDEEKVKNASLCIENAHGQNIWNVHLQPWKTPAEFWELYESRYLVLLEKTRNFLRSQAERLKATPNSPPPKAAIFLSAGFDASEWESAGMQRHKVNVPTEFYARIAKDVVQLSMEAGNNVEGRVVSVLEGGYSDRALTSGVMSHLSGFATKAPLIKQEPVTGLGLEMGQKLGTFDVDESTTICCGPSFNPSWWALPQLEQLDALVNPPPPPVEPKKKGTAPPTYFSTTQSFSAKVVTSPKLHKSASNSSLPSPKLMARGPTPPPPEVNWAVATHQLSKILIPSDRQTKSCRPEDLGAEATRARRDRQSLLTPAPENPPAMPAPSTRMALRERKQPKAVEEPKDAATRARRRRTVADTVSAEKPASRPLPKAEPSFAQPTKSSHRLSLTSNTGATSGASAKPTNRVISQPARPGTAQSVQSTAPAAQVAVKKTRPPAAPKTSRPKKVASTAPNTPGKTGGSDVKENKAPREEDDVDSLTSGFKNFKINLVTQAQREAREQAKLAEQATSSSPEQWASAPPESTKMAPAQEPELPTSSPFMAPSSMSTAHSSVAGSTPVSSPPTDSLFIPYHPSGATTGVTMTQPAVDTHVQADLQWLPPNSATPQHRKADLPVFTATSAIPFAPQGNREGHDNIDPFTIHVSAASPPSSSHATQPPSFAYGGYEAPPFSTNVPQAGFQVAPQHASTEGHSQPPAFAVPNYGPPTLAWQPMNAAAEEAVAAGAGPVIPPHSTVGMNMDSDDSF